MDATIKQLFFHCFFINFLILINKTVKFTYDFTSFFIGLKTKNKLEYLYRITGYE